MIAIIAHTFHVRPADILDERNELPDLTRLFFDFGCVKTINNLMSNKKNDSFSKQEIDQEKIEQLKKFRERKRIN
jgi:hypothetical protein